MEPTGKHSTTYNWLIFDWRSSIESSSYLTYQSTSLLTLKTFSTTMSSSIQYLYPQLSLQRIRSQLDGHWQELVLFALEMQVDDLRRFELFMFYVLEEQIPSTSEVKQEGDDGLTLRI
jgi:hypothetical protein